MSIQVGNQNVGFLMSQLKCIVFSIAALSPGAQAALYPRDYPGGLLPYGGRSMFGDVPPTPGSGSVTLPGSVESKSFPASCSS